MLYGVGFILFFLTLVQTGFGQSQAFYRIASTNGTRISKAGADGTLTVSNAHITGSFTIEASAALGGTNQWKTVACCTNQTTVLTNVTVPLGPWNSLFQRRTNLFLGGVVTDYLSKRTWDHFWQQNSPLQMMKTNGMEWVRAGVLTTSSQYLHDTPFDQWPTLPYRDEYWSSLEYTGQILREAATNGMRLNLFFFLSDHPADASQQNAPAAWSGLDVNTTAILLSNHTYTTTLYYQNQGLNIELYDIGNEIERGILNFRPDERIYRPPTVDILTDMNYMSNNVWNVEATLLKAAIAGVKQAKPSARIVLHIAGVGISPGDILVKSFFSSMVGQGVPFDYAGISHPYPSSGWFMDNYPAGCWFQQLKEIVDAMAMLHKPVIISEGAYAKAVTGITGGPVRDYPYTPAGQAAWVHDLLRFCGSTTNVAGFHYFYPDYFPGMAPAGVTENLQSSGLFSDDGVPEPALFEYRGNLTP